MHCDIAICHPRSHVNHRIQRACRSTGDAGKLKIIAQFFAFRLHAPAQHRFSGTQFQIHVLGLLLQIIQLRGSPHRQQQRFRMPGFHHVLVDTGIIDARDNVLRFGITGNNQAHSIRPTLAYLFQKLNTRNIRHTMVA